MFTTKEVCKLCRLPATTLREWVDKGIVKPARVGGLGRGNSHPFSYRQTYGLAMIAGLHADWGVYLAERGIKKIMASAETIPEQDMEIWLGPRKDDWAEEVRASWKKVLPQHSLEGVSESILGRVQVVCQEIARRLSLEDREAKFHRKQRNRA